MSSPDKPVSPKPYSASQPDEKKAPGANAPKAQRVPAKEGSTTPDQERGERIETGKIIARGGKSTGNVPGATEQKK